MTLEDWVHISYTPKEYKDEFIRLKKYLPVYKTNLDMLIHGIEHNKENKDIFIKRFNEIIDRYKIRIGEKAHNMYMNIYTCLIDEGGFKCGEKY